MLAWARPSSESPAHGGRSLVTLVRGAGLILAALNVIGTVTMRRRDFSRRRTLDASRTAIVVFVTTQTVVTAVVGAAVGAGVLIIAIAAK